MPPFRVVVVLDVVADRVVRFSAGLEGAAVDQLLLQRSKEALSDRVVPAIAGATHTAFGAVMLQQSTVRPARVLAAAVCVMHQPSRWLPACQRVLQCRNGQVQLERLVQRPAYDSSREEIRQDGEVDPTF